MMVLYGLALILTVALFGYLLAALFFPERFS